jgi:hypothetical protein
MNKKKLRANVVMGELRRCVSAGRREMDGWQLKVA